jgi:membrane-associated HD superfamily phosphohydrolase
MAEGLGLAASVIAVIGLAGQVVQGCQYIKGWVGDFRSAPKDVQDLMRELDTIQQSARILEQLEKKFDANIQAQLDPALQLCFDAVEEIRKKIEDADSTFKEPISRRRAKGWHRLKVVFGKQDLQTAVDKLSRAKATLGVAQSNVLL